MEYYFKAFKQYADFSGRARRAEYWLFMLFHYIVAFVLGIVNVLLVGGDPEPGVGTALVGIYGLVALIPGIAVTVRRLHDTGKSGWMIFVSLIPVIGAIWLLVLFATEGDQGPNEYGADPKQRTSVV